MLKLFQKWARVKEVIISKRLNRWGRRFGFVRFFDVGDFVSLERELDRCYIGNMKLHVNLPRYRREGLERYGRALSGEKNKSGGSVHPYVPRKNKEEWRKKTGKEALRNDVVKQSYAEVVRNSSHHVGRDSRFTTKKHILPWMTKSMVRHMKVELNFELL